jgi:hypothetical protein
VEGQQSVGCSESVRADRRASRPEHPLNRIVAGFGRAKIKAQIEKSGEERRTRLRSNGVYAFPKSNGNQAV